MKTYFREYLKSYQKSIRSFTPALRLTYTKLMNRFKEDSSTSDFDIIDSQKEGFENPSHLGVANRMYWWFPTHFFKFQDAIIRYEKYCREYGTAFLLDRPQVTFLDLGCGAGAASSALLSVLEEYQTFLDSQNLRIDPLIG